MIDFNIEKDKYRVQEIGNRPLSLYHNLLKSEIAQLCNTSNDLGILYVRSKDKLKSMYEQRRKMGWVKSGNIKEVYCEPNNEKSEISFFQFKWDKQTQDKKYLFKITEIIV